MAYTIVITKRAKQDIDALEVVVRRRLGKKLQQVTALSDIATVTKALVNPLVGQYRLRVGDYRVLFDIHGQNLIVLRVQHRREVYR